MTIQHDRCPLCGTEYNGKEGNCSIRQVEWGLMFTCNDYKRTFVVNDSLDYVSFDEAADVVFRRYNLIVAHLLKYPYADMTHRTYWKFFYEEQTIGNPIDDPAKVNIANNMMDYPDDFQHKIDQVLLSLSTKYATIGDQIPISGYDRALYYVTNNDPIGNVQEIQGILERLTELGYMRNGVDCHYEITANGWARISELLKEENEINQGFIAMAFRPETEEIGRVFHEAISECGYIPRRIDQKEHNNQIVPEIFFEIRRSKFMVVDVSFPNYGAYYEAGFGEALNKQVIVCCKQEVFSDGEKPHFDIAQKCTVVWSDLDDLKRRLKKRIEATVGLNRKSNNNASEYS
ncbi:hypothetical protein LJC74_08385 [Eubacteriales bacterium OttesenSCG-928-A19]|nr:hypothetical protein [Eubacteriales bacterium OttesenSCG-928-A19]